MLFFASSNGDLSNETYFMEKNIVNHWLTVAKQVKIAKLYT